MSNASCGRAQQFPAALPYLKLQRQPSSQRWEGMTGAQRARSPCRGQLLPLT